MGRPYLSCVSDKRSPHLQNRSVITPPEREVRVSRKAVPLHQCASLLHIGKAFPCHRLEAEEVPEKSNLLPQQVVLSRNV